MLKSRGLSVESRDAHTGRAGDDERRGFEAVFRLPKGYFERIAPFGGALLCARCRVLPSRQPYGAVLRLSIPVFGGVLQRLARALTIRTDSAVSLFLFCVLAARRKLGRSSDRSSLDSE